MVAAGFLDDRDGRNRDDSRMQRRDNQEEAPKLRSEIGDQGSREMTPEHTARPRNSSTDHVHYTGSETSAESSDQLIPSEIAGASSSSQKKKADLQ